MTLYYRGSEWNRWDLHVHTASSYDYKYKGSDADEKLCAALKQNNIKAVAITDHFKIDKTRIESLRNKAPGIVFFPGVELRTDKGASNLHIILIFSDESDLAILSADFEAIMLRSKAQSSDSDETIIWDFKDIVQFAKEHDALISIHAGRKANGIDKEITTNVLPVKTAIKSKISEAIHFFEVGQKRDIEYYETNVFKQIKRKPVIICSDNHNPNDYTVKEPLWIKADLTFSGLKQCLYQPEERVYIGALPPVLDRINKNKQSNIDSISCSRKNNPANIDSDWFDFDIPLNPGMVAVIGNKGSGKSAFSDILGHLCNCNTMESASFLNERRFKKKPKNFARDYSAALTWLDGKNIEKDLADKVADSSIEDAQYLPQQHIEEMCNNFDDTFQKEINKVIFSYVEKAERGNARDLDDLLNLKSKTLTHDDQNDRMQLKDINSKIIELERKLTGEYRKTLSDGLNKAKETLERHEKSKPAYVAKPQKNGADVEYQTKLAQLNNAIQEANNKKKGVTDEITEINTFINDINDVVAEVSQLQKHFYDIQSQIEALVCKHELERSQCSAELIVPTTYFDGLISNAETEKESLNDSISELSQTLNTLEAEKKELISSADSAEKMYQKYLEDLEEWNQQKAAIIGDNNTPESIEFFKHELEYIDTKLEDECHKSKAIRTEITERLYDRCIKLASIYQDVYRPVQNEIAQLLDNFENGVQFQPEVFMKKADLAKNIHDFINQKYNGKYGRGCTGLQDIESRVKNTDFGNKDDVMKFVEDMADVITSDLDTAEKRVSKRQEFYDLIFGLEYIGVDFKLKTEGRSLDELSPGERGMVLLIFYLALSKERKPLIIDQPEDNLDNQSVYSKLVPCIRKAKQQRQVIIVTHNPNIAVACDAEQIVYCEKDKKANHIRYKSGSIENPEIRKHVVEVLEGTMPAFDLRRLKYT